ncbi:MAG TPA: membrane protein insertase YidC [Planctomycetota bacterium]|nr:membrane protein insertase YidC [Planctomycetota bacterium]HRR82793.1 membrane protein insertase YidC [Planctomycetota bacterium]HRT96538.1 membrane protein insertase YidC [Planctomycetota bacterium]
MNQYDDFDPDGQQQDGTRAIIALLVIMGLVLLWGTVIAPMVSPPPAATAPEAAKPATADPVPSAKGDAKAPALTTAAPAKAGTATPAKGEPPAKEKPPEPAPAAHEPQAPAIAIAKLSPLFHADFTSQDARLARLILLDHFRTPAAKRAALRAKKRDPNADLSPFGLPLLGQEDEDALENGGAEFAEQIAPGQGPPQLPLKWLPSPREALGKAVLWSESARTGSRSLALKDPGADGVEWSTLVRGIQASATYELSCWMRLEAPDGLSEAALPSLTLLQQDAEGKEVELKAGGVPTRLPAPARVVLRPAKADGWQPLGACFVPEAQTRSVQVVFRAPGSFKGQVWLDDASLLKFGEPSLVLLPPKKAASEALSEADLRLFESRRYELVEEAADRVAFRAVLPDRKLEITKTFILPKPDEARQRHVTLEVQFRNTGDQELKLPGYLLRGPSGLPADLSPASWKHHETVPNEHERTAAAAALVAAVAREATGGQINVPTKTCAEVASLEKGSDKDKGTTFDEVGGVLWAAVASNYFASILDPRPAESRQLNIESGGARSMREHNLSAVIQAAPFALQPQGKEGDCVTHRFVLYAGPKAPDVLASYEGKYERLIASRWLDPLTAACGWVLRASYWVVPNYGIAIIILTIIVRVVLHPLSKKSQVSMQKMQKLQPQVAEIREKFKTDKKRQQEEMMKLYKTYGVNPMGGCLPIVLQIPIFIGLWRALQESIELRQAPFALWIQDLSQPDALFGAVNVLPIASCVIMFIQQKLTPKAGDPQQQQTQKMMGYMMPVFLGWILYSLPSGLALYFIASTLIGLGEQKVIKMHMARMGDLKPVAQTPSKQARKAVYSKGDKRPKKKLF